jgi:hypothetical protein
MKCRSAHRAKGLKLADELSVIQGELSQVEQVLALGIRSCHSFVTNDI